MTDSILIKSVANQAKIIVLAHSSEGGRSKTEALVEKLCMYFNLNFLPAMTNENEAHAWFNEPNKFDIKGDLLDKNELGKLPIGLIPIAVMQELVKNRKVSFDVKPGSELDEFLKNYANLIWCKK